MNIEVRAARPEDLYAAARVLATAFADYRQDFAAYFADVTDVHARVREAELFVALDGDTVVGTGALYLPGRPAPEPWPAEWASLRVLSVAPSHRGRGIGRLLIDARCRRAREAGAAVVGLHTSPRFSIAHRIVSDLGWERAADFDWYPVPEVLAEAWIRRLR